MHQIGLDLLSWGLVVAVVVVVGAELVVGAVVIVIEVVYLGVAGLGYMAALFADLLLEGKLVVAAAVVRLGVEFDLMAAPAAGHLVVGRQMAYSQILAY